MGTLDVSEMMTVHHDVLVIGAGGAGLRAAIAAADEGLDTGVVCKSLLGKAHTVMAEGGAAAALGNADGRDNWKIHFRDTMRGGKFLNQWRMAELHAQQAPDRIRELEAWGAVFDRTADGRINQRNFGGHRYPRLAHVGDRTGLEMIRTLQDKAVHTSGVSVHMECTALRILKDGDRVAGVLAMWKDTGRFVLFRCKAVIMATGGFGRAWRVTSNSWEYTGDGQAMAYEAGAELMDVEFTQFHPTGMVWPPSVAGVLVTEGVRGEGGILTNNRGERFMFNYIPEKFAKETADTVEEGERWLAGDKEARRPPELLTRDVVARAIAAEVAAGRGSPHGGAFLDIASRRPAEVIKKKLPSMYHQFKELAEVDITKEAMEVGPTLHYIMGGIRVDHDTQMTRVPGLFAAGECGAGLHGANRLGGNSLSDLLVFGRLAGLGAASYIRSTPATTIQEAEVRDAVRSATSFLNRESGPNPFVVHDELRDVMGRHVGIWRTSEGLTQGIAEIRRLQGVAATVKAQGTSQYNPAWSEALDLQNLVICSEMVARAALLREESRGAHSREDFQGEREGWGSKNIVIRKGADGRMETEILDTQGPDALSHIANASLEELEEPMPERTLRAWRGDASGGQFEEYTVEVDPGMVVLDLVHRAQAGAAPDLACRWNCKAGKCGSCSMEINGRPRLACMTRVGDFPPDQPITVQPLKAFPIIRDLVTDVRWNFQQNKRITPFTPGPRPADGNYRMSQNDVDRVQEFRKCIECFLCQDTCHVVRDHDKKAEFVGPRFMIRLASLDMHPLDTVDRIPAVRDEYGSGYCNITKCCTEVCPEHIAITDNGIIPLKERVVSRFYDPVAMAMRALFGPKAEAGRRPMAAPQPK